MKKPIRIEGGFAYVPLTKGYEAVIDVDDLHIVQSWSWHARPNGNTVYPARSIWGNGKTLRTVYMHTEIMDPPEGMQVGHINGDGLDNRRSNLRLATKRQITTARRTGKNNSSGFKGVSRQKGSNKWRAAIRVDGKDIRLGSFDNPEDAHKAYKKASAKYHGEFGRCE